MTEDPALYEKPSPLRRVFQATECRTQTELAALLGIRQSSISDAKKRNAIPAEWLIKLLRLKNINPEWILTGLGSERLVPAKAEQTAPVAPLSKTTILKECSAQELASELVRRALANG